MLLKPSKIVPGLLALSTVLAACAAPAAAPSNTPGAAPTSAPAAAATTAPAAAPTSAPAAAQATAAPKAAATSAPQAGGKELKVAFVYTGPAKDGGWSEQHDKGRQYLEQSVPGVKTSYIENVPEGADAEREIRNFAQQGNDIIFTTSFGFMDPTEAVSKDYPKTIFEHNSGFKKNTTNFGNYMGALEQMKYLAGIAAGAKAKADGKTLIGYVAPFPIPEVVRLGNAMAIGVKESCPECKVRAVWIFTWFDPAKETQAAESLLDAGADVIVSGSDTPGPIQAAGKRGKWGVANDNDAACDVDKEHCLATTYWNWGVYYKSVAEQVKAGTWKPVDYYGDVDSGIVDIKLGPGVPDDVKAKINAKLADMKAGKFTRFELFKGPIKDNKGNVVVPDGQKLTQSDLEGLKGVPGRPDCTVCMSWLFENFDGDLPKS